MSYLEEVCGDGDQSRKGAHRLVHVHPVSVAEFDRRVHLYNNTSDINSEGVILVRG